MLCITVVVIPLLLLFLCVGIKEAQIETINVVSRNRNGDEYNICNGTYQTLSCPSSRPTLGSDGVCKTDFDVRNEYCSSHENQIFLSPPSRNSLEIFVIVGNDGILEVFNNESGMYEDGIIVNNNIINNVIERQNERNGCDITSMEAIQSFYEATNINSSGFIIHLDGGHIQLQVDEVNLAFPRQDYDGEIFRLNLSCATNAFIDCMVIKLNGIVNVSEEKFGLPSNSINDCEDISDITTTYDITSSDITSSDITSSDITSSASSQTPSSTLVVTLRSSRFWEDPVYQRILIGVGCGIGIFIFFLSILVVGICKSLKTRTKEIPKTMTSLPTTWNHVQVDQKEDIVEMMDNSSYAVIKRQKEQLDQQPVYANINM